MRCATLESGGPSVVLRWGNSPSKGRQSDCVQTSPSCRDLCGRPMGSRYSWRLRDASRLPLHQYPLAASICSQRLRWPWGVVVRHREVCDAPRVSDVPSSTVLCMFIYTYWLHFLDVFLACCSICNVYDSLCRRYTSHSMDVTYLSPENVANATVQSLMRSQRNENVPDTACYAMISSKNRC